MVYPIRFTAYIHHLVWDFGRHRLNLTLDYFYKACFLLTGNIKFGRRNSTEPVFFKTIESSALSGHIHTRP